MKKKMEDGRWEMGDRRSKMVLATALWAVVLSTIFYLPSSAPAQTGNIYVNEDHHNHTITNVSNWVSVIGFTTDGAGATISTGTKGYFTVGYSGTITGWSISAVGASPTCTIDVWKITGGGTALPTVTNTIMGNKPQLRSGNVIYSPDAVHCSTADCTLTGWTTTFAAGDTFGFNIDAVANATMITFTLETVR